MVSDRSDLASHQPDNAFDCVLCEAPWPCGAARAYLTRTNNRQQLLMRMGAELDRAAYFLIAPQGQLYERFLSWARRPPQHNRVSNSVPPEQEPR